MFSISTIHRTGTRTPPATRPAPESTPRGNAPNTFQRAAALRAAGSPGSSRQVAITCATRPVRAAASYASIPPILAPNSTSGLLSDSVSAQTNSLTNSTQSRYRTDAGFGSTVSP
ncbi:hypothetical protein [Nocardia sp. GTS18]|uniref:hypothetical protein n=1 Tax=Nocardia sp. GTS18 TaxID=1778064 RepID=UPI0015EF1F6F